MELGKLFDTELKNSLTATGRKVEQDEKSQIEQHLLVDDHSIGALSKETQIKIGGFLTNIMCKNLKYKIGKKEFLLLKPQTIREGTKKT